MKGTTMKMKTKPKAIKPMVCAVADLENVWAIKKGDSNAYYHGKINEGPCFVMIGNGGASIGSDMRRFIGTAKTWKAANEMFNGWRRESPFLFHVQGGIATLAAGYFGYGDETERLELAKKRLELHAEGTINLNSWELEADRKLVNPPPPPPRTVTIPDSEHTALLAVAEAAKCVQYECGKLAFLSHEKELYSAWTNMTNAIQALAAIAKATGK